MRHVQHNEQRREAEEEIGDGKRVEECVLMYTDRIRGSILIIRII